MRHQIFIFYINIHNFDVGRVYNETLLIAGPIKGRHNLIPGIKKAALLPLLPVVTQYLQICQFLV